MELWEVVMDLQEKVNLAELRREVAAEVLAFTGKPDIPLGILLGHWEIKIIDYIELPYVEEAELKLYISSTAVKCTKL